MIDSWDSATKLLASAFSDIDTVYEDGAAAIKSDTDKRCFDNNQHVGEERKRWLMNWKNRNKSTVKYRVAAKKNALHSIAVRTKPTFTNISLGEYVASESVPKDVYFVTLNAPNGVGMNLFVSYEGLVLVQGLYKLRNGSSSPAQNCGVIAVGDQLVQLNDINIEALSFYETTDLLKDLDLLAKDKIITLGFRYMDSAIPLPPEIEESASKDNEQDLRLNSELLCEHERKFVKQLPRDPSIQDMLTLRQSPLVEDAFLALFALDEPQSNNLPISDGIATKNVRPDPTPFTSELDTLQQDMRQRHMYPAAARVSALAGTTHPAALLHEVAEEVYEWRPVHLCRQYAAYYTPRAISDYNTPYGAVLSGLIVSPLDTAVYQNTQQLVWNEERQCYVEPPSLHASVPGTIIDTMVDMQDVLRTIEREYRQKVIVGKEVDGGDAQYQKSYSGDKIAAGIAISEKLSAHTNNEQRHATQPPVIVGNNQHSAIIMHGSSLSPAMTVHNGLNQCIIKPTLYNATPTIHTTKQPYYYLKQSHFISFEHTSVQQLLCLPSFAILSQLSTIVDDTIENICASTDNPHITTNTDNPFHNAKYYETNTEISIPPMLLTHQLLYTAQHFKPLLLQNEAFLTILERWATTFDPKGIIQALQMQTTQRNVRAASAQAGSSGARTTHDSATKKEFLVYFNNDPHTVRNLQPFVDVIKELLTFLLVSRVSPQILCISSGSGSNDQDETRTYSNTSSENNVSCASIMTKNFRLLPVSLDLSAQSAKDKTQDSDSPLTLYPDSVAASCIRKFGLLLLLDSVAISASSAHYSRTLQAVIDTASCDGAYKACVSTLQELVAKSVGTMLSAQQLIDQLGGRDLAISSERMRPRGSEKSITSGANRSQGCPYLLCLLLQHLDTIFAQNTQLALDLTTLLYPLISPWNVQNTLFPPEEHEASDDELPVTMSHYQYSNNSAVNERMDLFHGVGVSSSVNTSPATSLSSSAAPSPAASPRGGTNVKDASFHSPQLPLPLPLPSLPPLQATPLSSLYTSPLAAPAATLASTPTLPIQRSGGSTKSTPQSTESSKIQLSNQTERELDRLLSRTSSNQSVLSLSTAPTAAVPIQKDNNTMLTKGPNVPPQAPRPSLQGGLCAQNTYYGYLTRLFRMHTALCTNSPNLVLSWLETALSLAHQDSFHAINDEFSAFASVYATPKGKKKNPFSITVRNLLHSPEQYCLNAVSGMQLCVKYSHLEGVVTLCERLVPCDNASVTYAADCETMQLHPEDLSVVLNVLTQACGQQLSQIMTLVSKINDSERKSRLSHGPHSSARCSDDPFVFIHPHESTSLESLNTMSVTATSLLRLLTLAARALCQHQHHQLNGNDTSVQGPLLVVRRFESPEWSIFGDILNTIAHEQFYELPAQSGTICDRVVLSQVANMVGECVRFAVGTEKALLVLEHAPVLVELITC